MLIKDGSEQSLMIKRYFEILKANYSHVLNNTFLCESCGRKCINFVDKYDANYNELHKHLQQSQPLQQPLQQQHVQQVQVQQQNQQENLSLVEFIHLIDVEAKFLSCHPKFTKVAANNIKNVDLLELVQILEETAPNIQKIFKTISKSEDELFTFPEIIAISILLKQRNRKCTVIQKVIAILLSNGSADKRV